MNGENQNAGFGHEGQNLPRRIQTVQVRHADVEQQDVGLELGGTLDCFATILCLGAHFPSLMRL